MREEKRYKNSQGAIESKKADLTQEKQKLIDEVKAKTTTTSFIHTASVLQKVKSIKKKHSEQHQKQTSRLTEL